MMDAKIVPLGNTLPLLVRRHAIFACCASTTRMRPQAAAHRKRARVMRGTQDPTVVIALRASPDCTRALSAAIRAKYARAERPHLRAAFRQTVAQSNVVPALPDPTAGRASCVWQEASSPAQERHRAQTVLRSNRRPRQEEPSFLTACALPDIKEIRPDVLRATWVPTKHLSAASSATRALRFRPLCRTRALRSPAVSAPPATMAIMQDVLPARWASSSRPLAAICAAHALLCRPHRLTPPRV